MISSITYEANGDTDQIVYANGTATDLSYAADRRWLTQVTTTGPSGTLQDVSYTRAAAGCIDAITGTGTGLKDKWVYIYDNLDRLLSADNTEDNTLDQSFTYDALGNMTYNSKVGTYVYPIPGPSTVRPDAVTQINPNGNPALTQINHDAAFLPCCSKWGRLVLPGICAVRRGSFACERPEE